VGGQNLPTYATDFHVYSLEWTAEKLVFAVDGVEHFTYNPADKNPETWPFDAEQYLLFNVAILPSIAPDFTSSAMEVDYVRIYQESPVAATSPQKSTVRYFPNPVEDTLTIELGIAVAGPVHIRLFDSSGRVLKSISEEASQGTVLLRNWGSLPSGAYQVQVRWGQQQSAFKVVKY
jgi:beta-glucanase (GH16 family)